MGKKHSNAKERLRSTGEDAIELNLQKCTINKIYCKYVTLPKYKLARIVMLGHSELLAQKMTLLISKM